MPSFPIKKILLLGFCRLAEPIAITSISPYIFFMIKSFGITEDEAQIAKYAGIVSSSFAFSECLSSVIWGRLSDKYGRKCIIILGLCGTSISVLWFGFSRSFTMIIIARSLAGLLNGNVGVIRTVVPKT
ncbi:putative membrane protein [Neolecta irregularis DAH-3]|uniref:Putative membrane protein n=1 Tax=Neolecta irregularis (strain DAH-3) TaxID=1198029 RepID=A0A1U7LT79_NEOID|nr:putative membrane protein [Neolecta irregularis DAH-3]|eukprot:OLL25867.1 putative membrane protein [Neolecta irregularis DAH-3]